MFKALDLARAQEGMDDLNNALEVEFQKRVETTTSRLILMGNAIQDLKIDMGTLLLPTIKKFADTLGGLVLLYNKLMLFTMRNLTIVGGSFALFFTTFKKTLLAVAAATEGLNISLTKLGLSIGRLAGLLSAATLGFGFLIMKMAQSKKETQDLIDLIVELQQAQAELTNQQKLDLLFPRG